MGTTPDKWKGRQQFEKGPHVSFSNCCLPFHLSGVVPTADDLILMTPELLKSQYNLDVKVEHEVVKINKEEKTITIRKVDSGEEYEESKSYSFRFYE